MKSLLPEEFIAGLLSAHDEIKIEVSKFYHFNQISIKNNYFCSFNFDELYNLTSLYPALFDTSENNAIVISKNIEKSLQVWKRIYGITDDFNNIFDIWEEI